MVKQIKDKQGKVVAEMLTEDDVPYTLDGKRLAIIGYASQGRGQGLSYRDSGVDVILGLRKGGESWKKAIEDGWQEGETLFEIEDAAKKADIILMLVADVVQSEVYNEKIKPHFSKGKTLAFSHGFNIIYGGINPPKDVDIVMVAPKGPGAIVREMYENNFGVPALVAVHQDYTGNAWKTVLAMAKAIGATKPGIFKTTFKDEVESDLFGEQVDLCGGVIEMVKHAYDVLIESGYNPVLAYFEVHHELYGLIAPLAYKYGNAGMLRSVSLTARDGAIQSGKEVMDDHVKQNMRNVLKKIQIGDYAKGWMKRYKEQGFASVDKPVEELEKHPLEFVGKQVRNVMWPNQGRW